MHFNRVAFEELLARELELHGLTAAAWAKAHGISPGALHEIRFPKAGRPRKPSSAMTLRLAEALGVPIRAIAAGPVPEQVAS